MISFSFRRWCVMVCGVWLLSTMEAQAYVDPGSTSYLFQLLIGGLTAMAFFFGSIRRGIKAGWQKLFHRRGGVTQQPSLPTEQTATKDV